MLYYTVKPTHSILPLPVCSNYVYKEKKERGNKAHVCRNSYKKPVTLSIVKPHNEKYCPTVNSVESAARPSARLSLPALSKIYIQLHNLYSKQQWSLSWRYIIAFTCTVTEAAIVELAIGYKFSFSYGESFSVCVKCYKHNAFNILLYMEFENENKTMRHLRGMLWQA